MYCIIKVIYFDLVIPQFITTLNTEDLNAGFFFWFFFRNTWTPGELSFLAFTSSVTMNCWKFWGPSPKISTLYRYQWNSLLPLKPQVRGIKWKIQGMTSAKQINDCFLFVAPSWQMFWQHQILGDWSEPSHNQNHDFFWRRESCHAKVSWSEYLNYHCYNLSSVAIFYSVTFCY